MITFKNNKLKFIYLLSLCIAVFMSSCKNGEELLPTSKPDAPEPLPPVDEVDDKGHDGWAKVVFMFHRGHLHGKSFHGNPYNEEVKYFGTKDSVVFAYDEKGNLTKPTEPLHLIKGEVYALEISYYDKDGKLMNTQFATEEMSPIHQHFFLTKNAKKIDTDADFANPEKIIRYSYRDTDPIDKNIKSEDVEVKLRDANDPLGFKGYFHIDEAYVSFDLNVILVHIVKGNKLKEDGSAYPFNAPNKAFLGTQDLNLKIPVRVYTARPGDGEDDFDIFMSDMAKEFGITKDEAEDDWLKQVDTPFESSNFWM